MDTDRSSKRQKTGFGTGDTRTLNEETEQESSARQPILTDSSRQIRLLRVLEDDVKRPNVLSLEVTVHDIYTVDSYVAISYTWGPETPKKKICVNGSVLEVRDNCFQALKQTHRHYKDCYLWIDTICINQNVHVEKSAQIRLMGQIYSRAQVVAACISLPDIDLCQLEDQIGQYSLLHQIIKRPYFHRLWVVQECVLAAKVDVICGKTRLSRKAFHSCLYHWTSRPREQSDRAVGEIFRFMRDWEQKDVIGRLKPTIQGFPLTDLILLYGRRECCNPRDKIYGLLPMASSKMQRGLPVDYDKPLVEVLLDLLGTYERLRMDHGDFQNALNVARLLHDSFAASCTVYNAHIMIHWQQALVRQRPLFDNHLNSAKEIRLDSTDVWYHIITNSDELTDRIAIRDCSGSPLGKFGCAQGKASLDAVASHVFRGHKGLLKASHLPSEVNEACIDRALSMFEANTYLHVRTSSGLTRIFSVPCTTAIDDILLWKVSQVSNPSEGLVCRKSGDSGGSLEIIGAALISSEIQEFHSDAPTSVSRRRHLLRRQSRKLPTETSMTSKIDAEEVAVDVLKDVVGAPESTTAFDPSDYPYRDLWTELESGCQFLVHPLDLLTISLGEMIDRPFAEIALLPVSRCNISLPEDYAKTAVKAQRSAAGVRAEIHRLSVRAEKRSKKSQHREWPSRLEMPVGVDGFTRTISSSIDALSQLGNDK